MPPLKIYCLVLNYRHHLDTEKCINALLKSDIPKGAQILIVDNSPTNTSYKYLSAKFPRVKILRNKHNLGFAGGNNVGINQALKSKASHILIINPDVIIGSKFFGPLIKDLDNNSKLGLIAPAIEHYQGQHKFFGMEGHIDWSLMKTSHTNLAKLPASNKLRFGDFVTFACVLIRPEVFKSAGLMDDRYFMYLEDVDFCLMALGKNYLSAVDPSVIVGHRTSSSFAKPTDKLKLSFFSQLKFVSKWRRFPYNLKPYIFALLFYPYLYLLWTVHYYRDFFRPKT